MLERKARTRLVTALLLLLVLASGFALGLAVERRVLAEGVSTGAESGEEKEDEGEEGERSGEEGASRSRSLIVEQVGLSEAQKARVDSIVGEFRTRMRSLHKEFDEAYSARYREILEDTRDEIKAVLSPEQRTAYDSLLVEWDRRRAEKRRDDSSDSGSSRERH